MGDVALTIESVTQLSARLAGLLEVTDKNGDLTGTLRNLRGASAELQATLKETRVSLKSTLEDAAATAKTTRALTAGREGQLGKAIDSFSSAADKLDRLSGRLDSLRSVLQTVANKVDRGEGTLGKMVNDRKLYNDVAATVDSLQALIVDIKKNPKKYIKLEIF
jgi:phospholipid/cholesterol/gamma-HCH transport system substrate-binding protein